jgi:crotonobetainyl-CoA:carnitine CoA-transferase CaiB-like acyl-CoA transferase
VSGPLDGVRVLDLTSVVMGPMATQILGDLGADVITVESSRGDTNRSMGPGPSRQLSDVSLNLLRNKRNVALDLKHPDGRAALLRIVATCDVFVTNLRPLPLGRLELDYDTIAGVRPDIIFCQAQGFPSDGGRANEPAYDDIIQGAAGVPDVVRRAGADPALLPTLLADKVSGLVLTYAILAALYHRAVTGQGQHIELPMVDALTSFLLVEHSSGAVTGSERSGAGYRRILTPNRSPKRTRDGWIVVFPYLQAHWEALLRAGGADDLIDDPRLSHLGRQSDPGFGYATLERVLATRTTADWLSYCGEGGIPATAVGNVDELVASLPDEQHPVIGAYKSIPSPVRFSATPATVRRHAPFIGQHNHEVLAEVGYDAEEVARLEAVGALRRSRVHPTPGASPGSPDAGDRH